MAKTTPIMASNTSPTISTSINTTVLTVFPTILTPHITQMTLTTSSSNASQTKATSTTKLSYTVSLGTGLPGSLAISKTPLIPTTMFYTVSSNSVTLTNILKKQSTMLSASSTSSESNTGSKVTTPTGTILSSTVSSPSTLNSVSNTLVPITATISSVTSLGISMKYSQITILTLTPTIFQYDTTRITTSLSQPTLLNTVVTINSTTVNPLLMNSQASTVTYKSERPFYYDINDATSAEYNSTKSYITMTSIMPIGYLLQTMTTVTSEMPRIQPISNRASVSSSILTSLSSSSTNAVTYESEPPYYYNIYDATSAKYNSTKSHSIMTSITPIRYLFQTMTTVTPQMSRMQSISTRVSVNSPTLTSISSHLKGFVETTEQPLYYDIIDDIPTTSISTMTNVSSGTTTKAQITRSLTTGSTFESITVPKSVQKQKINTLFVTPTISLINPIGSLLIGSSTINIFNLTPVKNIETMSTSKNSNQLSSLYMMYSQIK